MREPMILGLCALALASCTPAVTPDATPDTAPEASKLQSAATNVALSRIAELEAKSGGRLGVALLDGQGQLLLDHRGDARFAMCSTFKLPLAILTLHAAQNGLSLRTPLPISRDDLMHHSPYAETVVDSGEIRIGFAAEAAVSQSDNAAANVILKELGGPEGFTKRLRALGDDVSRLDRNEPGLNLNAANDPRDTSSPRMMALWVHRALNEPDLLAEGHRKLLRDWMVNANTGLSRIRAGLPEGWVSGDKTGTCGKPNPEHNDVAFITTPDGRFFVLSVFLDKSKLDDTASNAVIADVARAIVGVIEP